MDLLTNYWQVNEAFLELVNNSIQNQQSDDDDDLVYFSKESADVVVNSVGALELMVFIVGTPANVLVLLVALKIQRQRGRKRQHGEWLVMTMTSFDLLFCATHAPMMFVWYLLRVHYNDASCMVMYWLTHLATTGSSLSLLALNVDKFLHLYRPLHYRHTMTDRRVKLAAAVICLLAVVWASFLIFGPFMINQVTDGHCEQGLRTVGVYVFFATGFFALPTLASLAVSIFTVVVVIRARRSDDEPEVGRASFLRRTRSTGNPAVLESMASCSSAMTPGNRRLTPVELAKLVGFIFATTLWTSVTTLPYRVGYMWKGWTRLSDDQHVCLMALFGLMALNAVGNPFITITAKKKYSQQLSKYLADLSDNSARLGVNLFPNSLSCQAL